MRVVGIHCSQFFTAVLWLAVACANVLAEEPAFDGEPWHISTGNLSVSFIQASPIGAFPRDNYLEPPPPVEAMARLKRLGLVANEDYIAWGAVEREPGKWEWAQHDAMEQALHKAGLKYVVYNWAHFPPVWLREDPAKRTLMRCLEHGQETNYLSIFDPRTIEWYDHFYKNIHAHFGDRVDHIYACILGPYGEGNYPQLVPSWINMGHCHEGYWCGDEHAVIAFQVAMDRKYGEIAKLNQAWGTDLKSFDGIRPPHEISVAEFKPTPAAFPTPQARRRWLDFITWYHQAIIDFAEQSLKIVLKYYPPEKVRMKPGGSAGGVNPISWGTYCPGYARMAKGYGVVLQPADCQGAVFADKWMGTAYQFYGVRECTEPAGDLDDRSFVRRMYSDASAGAAQLFTYQFERHAANARKYVHLFTGKPSETEIAVYCPTTLYRLGENLQPTIQSSHALRDVCDYDVLDEALIMDGALTTDRYKVLIAFQADIVDQPVLEIFSAFQKAGGRVIVAENVAVKNVEGDAWAGEDDVTRVPVTRNRHKLLQALKPKITDCKGFDGRIDGVWLARRSKQVLAFNSNDKRRTVKGEMEEVTIPAFSIHEFEPRSNP